MLRMLPPRMHRIIPAIACAVLAACMAHPPAPADLSIPANLQAPAEFPHAFYHDAAARGETVLQVRPTDSYVAVEVRRSGPLARLGHDHVIASRNVQGYVHPSARRADLFVPLLRLTIDEAELRAASGMDTQPSREAIEGTRRNMLDKVLDAERFPFALIHVVRKEGDRLRVTIRLHGQTNEVEAPALIESMPGKLIISGRLSVAQTDFGITPFSVLGGALQVQDTLVMRYRIVATPV